MGYNKKTAKELIEGHLYWYQHTDDEDIKRVAFNDIIFVFEQLVGFKLEKKHIDIIEFYVFDKISYDEAVKRISEDIKK